MFIVQEIDSKGYECTIPRVGLCFYSAVSIYIDIIYRKWEYLLI